MAEKVEHKQFVFEIKELKASEDGRRALFTGYASTFGNIDLVGDIVKQGAFAKTIAADPTVNVLVDHRATVKTQIGYGFNMSEDAKGLFTTTEINLEKDAGREAYATLLHAKERGFKVGLSIGFMIVESDFDRKEGIRTITEVKLFEYSVVIFPANPKATVTAVKSVLESGKKEDVALLKRGIESHLREACGFSESEAKGFVAVGFRDMREAKENATKKKETEAYAAEVLGSLISKKTGDS